MIALPIIAGVLLLADTVILLLMHFGILSAYHPVKNAKDDQIKVACVGDSITYGLFVDNRDKNNYPDVLNKLLGDTYCVNNFAYTNRTAIKSGDCPFVNEKVYQQSLDFQPNIVIILLGSNDSKPNNWDKDKFLADYSEIIDSYLTLESQPKVYVLLPPPVFEIKGKVLYQIRKDIIEQEIVPAVEDIANKKNVGCIDVHKVFQGRQDLFFDGVHPNVNGSRLLAQSVYEAIKDCRM